MKRTVRTAFAAAVTLALALALGCGGDDDDNGGGNAERPSGSAPTAGPPWSRTSRPETMPVKNSVRWKSRSRTSPCAPVIPRRRLPGRDTRTCTYNETSSGATFSCSGSDPFAADTRCTEAYQASGSVESSATPGSG